MKEITKKIPEERVDVLQELDCKVRSMQAVLTNLLDMHALDNSTKIISSPIVTEYQKQITQAQREFEDAKDAIVNEFISEDVQKKVTTWSIKYSTCELVYVVE